MFNAKLCQHRPSGPDQDQDYLQSLRSDHQQTKEQLNSVQNQLDSAVSERSRTPAHLKREIFNADEQIKELQNALFSLQLKIRNQDEELRLKDIRIHQQAETIQIHSEEMAKTHNRSARFDPTPIRLPSQQGLATHYQNQAPPLMHNQNGQSTMSTAPYYKTKWGDMPGSQPQRTQYQTTNGNYNTLNSYSPSTFHSPERSFQIGVDGNGSPASLGRGRTSTPANLIGGPSLSAYMTPPRMLQPAGSSRDMKSTPPTSHGSGGVPIPPMPSQTPDRPDSVMSKPRSTTDGAITPFGSSNVRQAGISKAFSDLFDRIVEFTYDYVNVPSTHADSNLPQDLKQALMNAATKTTAHKIMSSQNTRYLLIAKVIMCWVQSKVFAETTFFELDKGTENAVSETRKKIFNNTPPAVRFVFLQDITKQFSRLQQHPKYNEFMTTTSNSLSAELWNIVRPLMYHKKDGDWTSVHNLVVQALQVAEMQVLDTTEYRLFFPKIYDPFNDASMINMDPEYDHMAPDELMSQRANVLLGVVPQVMARITGPDGNTMTKTLLKAGVLLRLGGDRKY